MFNHLILARRNTAEDLLSAAATIGSFGGCIPDRKYDRENNFTVDRCSHVQKMFPCID